MLKEKEVKEIRLSDYPKVYNADSKFWNDFYDFLTQKTGTMNRAEYNLICSKRDVSLYTKRNMKPHRFWKVSDVKKYFCIKGSGDKLLSEFNEVYDQYFALKDLMYSSSKDYFIKLVH